MQADSTLFWARVKKLSGHLKSNASPPPMARNTDGNVASDPLEVLSIWKKFAEKMAVEPPDEADRYDAAFKHDTTHRLRCYELLQRELLHDELDAPISEQEVFSVLKKLKNGKAPGLDGILTTILKSAAGLTGKTKLKSSNTVVEAITIFFNYVFDNECWPERWSSGVVFPLYKQGDRLDPSNYRPITLLSSMGKLFGSIVENRLSSWATKHDKIADEQGGFRRGRGTRDQIFILREILSSRKERGLPTLVTYIDARKAYDTVWREGNYVKLFDMGIQGKMWRQIRAMNGNLKSKIRLPVGETDFVQSSRGVAQGAVESPWLYNCFVNDLVQSLKDKGLGIVVNNIRIPILLYADDIILLASTVTELQRMNEVASDFAFKFRFRHNGDKSAVMVFNPDSTLRKRVRQHIWTLSGEKVAVKNKYKYLGVDMLQNTADWRPHLDRKIREARRKSKELLWICRNDQGLRPRSALTIWKALVRPILEYAAELFANDIPDLLSNKIEEIQTSFAKSILGLSHYRGIASDFIRSETGLEILKARREKLRLSYWRKLIAAEPTSILGSIANWRKQQVDAEGRRCSNSWMWTTKQLMMNNGLEEYWTTPKECMEFSQETWKKKIVYPAVEHQYETSRKERMNRMSSMTHYINIKHWSTTDSDRAVSKSEAGLPGALVLEKYLDDTKEKEGCFLKLLCRTNRLPTLSQIAREEDWPPAWAKCLMCASGEEENLQHILFHCTAYTNIREKAMANCQKVRILSEQPLQLKLFLGAQIIPKTKQYSPEEIIAAEDNIDHHIKRFLKLAWRKRKKLTALVNSTFNRQDFILKKHNSL